MQNSQLLPPDERGPARLKNTESQGTVARLDVISESQPEGDASGDSLDLSEYFEALKRHKGTILLIALLCALAGFVLGSMQTPLYLATTTLELQDLNENFLDIRDVTATGGNYPWASHMMTQVEVLKSNALIDRVVERLQLDKRPEFAARVATAESAGSAAADSSDQIQIPALTPKQIARNRTRGGLQIEPSRESRIIEVKFEWTKPDFAAEFVNALAQEYKQQAMEVRWKETQQTGEWLEKQLEGLKEKLRKSEEELQKYASVTGLMFTGERDSVAQEKLRQLQSALSGAQNERVTHQSRYETAIESSIESLPEVLGDGSLSQYQMQLTDLRRQMAELQTSFKPTYPRVRQLQAQIAELEATFERERSKIIDRIRTEYGAARKRESLLALDYASQARLVSEQSGKAIHYKILLQEVESNRQLYDSMLHRLREAGIASAMRASNVRVVDVAEPPRSPHKPNIPLSTMIGGLVGLFLGAVVAFARNSTDRSLRVPGDATRWLRLPELGVIPRREALPMSRRQDSLMGPIRLPLIGSARTSDSNGNYRKHWSPLAEYFRVTLTSILFAEPHGSHAKVLVITSPGPGEGKSSIASNLAITLAEIGKRVLVVDADMRKPRLHEVFNLPNTWGLSDLLKEKLPIENCPLEAIARHTQIPGLYVLPSGPGSKSIARLLHSSLGRQLLQRLRDEFDVVLIDTPPMLQISDARVIARMTDGVVLVLRAESTTRDSGKAAKERLEADGIPILGTVLNGWNPKQYGYGGYDNYKSYSRYYSDVSEARKQG